MTTELPFNLDAEQALLGAIFVNNEAFWRVADFLAAEQFYEPLHALIFDACASTIRGGHAATPITISSDLPEMATEDVTMRQYLSRLAGAATTVLNAADFGRVIRDDATRRALIDLSDDLREGAFERGGRPLAEIVATAEQGLFAMANAHDGREKMRGFGDAISEAIEMANAAYQRDGGLSGLATGLRDLDRLMGGLQRSDVVVVAARPGMGKTSLATNIAFHVARMGGPVAFYSLEMSAEQLATRVLAEQARISSSDIRRGATTEGQMVDLIETANSLRNLPIHIEDAGGLSIGQLAASARRMARRAGGISLIVVDYIQLLSGTTRRSGENRVQEITEITTKLKALAKELNVPILALSQLSRNVESRDDKRPQLSDLRDSGSIEQDADVVLFLYREEYYLKLKEPPEGTPKHMEWETQMEAAHGRAEIIISKQRHGPTGTVEVSFVERLTSFSDLARQAFMPGRAA